MSITTVTTTTTTTTTNTTQKIDHARLIFVLDRSGSMSSVKEEAIGGFNAFVQAQKNEQGTASMSLILFDNEVDIIHNDIDLKNVPILTDEVFVPRGMTSLYDAIGMTLSEFMNSKSSKSQKTILAILTDGEENSSKKFSGSEVAKLIKQAEDEYKWEVLFLGADINVEKIATNLNVSSNKFTSFNKSAKGFSDSYEAVNKVTSQFRMAASRGVVLDPSAVNLNTEYNNATTK
jgi:hypothetical protein